MLNILLFILLEIREHYSCKLKKCNVNRYEINDKFNYICCKSQLRLKFLQYILVSYMKTLRIIYVTVIDFKFYIKIVISKPLVHDFVEVIALAEGSLI